MEIYIDMLNMTGKFIVNASVQSKIAVLMLHQSGVYASCKFHVLYSNWLHRGWGRGQKPGLDNEFTSGDLTHDDVINGNIFRVTGPLCGEFTGPGEFPTQRPVTRSFDVFFDLRLNKRLSKQPWGWWFETLSWSLWRHRNDILNAVELRCWMLYFTNLYNQ